MPSCEIHGNELTKEVDHYYCETCRRNLIRLRYSPDEVIALTIVYADVPAARSTVVDVGEASDPVRVKRNGRSERSIMRGKNKTGVGSRGGRGGFVGHSSGPYED